MHGTGFGIMSKQHIPMLSCFSCSKMKVAVLLLLCLTAGSQASFLDDLKSAFSNIGSSLTTTFHAVGDQAKLVGQNLLTTAKEQGSQLASQALQSENCIKKRLSLTFVLSDYMLTASTYSSFACVICK